MFVRVLSEAQLDKDGFFSLKNQCFREIIKHNLPTQGLPTSLKEHFKYLCESSESKAESDDVADSQSSEDEDGQKFKANYIKTNEFRVTHEAPDACYELSEKLVTDEAASKLQMSKDTLDSITSLISGNKLIYL